MTKGQRRSAITDIKPVTPVAALDREALDDDLCLAPEVVAPVVGMSSGFIRKVVGHSGLLTGRDVLLLLDQDAFHETFIPRSRIPHYLRRLASNREDARSEQPNLDRWDLRLGNALDLIKELPTSSVNCVVTSTPYWGLRIYDDTTKVAWADGEVCAFGHEQTPEGFVRHTVELISAVARVLVPDGSVWWNIMDSYNTRTQIRSSAVEALRAMEGKDSRKWGDFSARRYSAGHAYLKDGEQCLIPQMIAERVSRLGLYVKSMITWAKPASLPEPQQSRVSRNLEYVIHITKQRTPKFIRDAYLATAPEFGGRNNGWESEKLSDVWVLNTASGGQGHGAQFPTALPGRCIALTTSPGDLVLDPFVGSGTAGVAALYHGCRFLGFDISQTYISLAKEKLSAFKEPQDPLRERR